jgi:hypothetical protein
MIGLWLGGELMRQLTLIVTALILFSVGSLSAAAVTDCAAVPGATVASPNDILFLYSTWTAAGFTCEQQDKIFSNFNPGTAPTDTTLRLLLQTLGGGLDIHTVVFGGSFTSDFTVGYTVSVDTGLSTETIFKVTGDIQNPGSTGSPSNLKMVMGSGGFTGSLTSTIASPGTPIAVPNLTSLNVTDSYTANGGAVTGIGNSFFQQVPSGVPEPGTTALFGAGLLAVGFISRGRRAKS